MWGKFGEFPCCSRRWIANQTRGVIIVLTVFDLEDLEMWSREADFLCPYGKKHVYSNYY
jgi:hypothetical protein